MKRDFETALVQQCAPALAGLKPANLFRWVEPDAAAMYRTVAKWQAALQPSGVSIRILKECPKTSAFLIYVYRQARLEQILAGRAEQAYLRSAGYTGVCGCDACLAQLSLRLCCDGDFPHEIGIFLGYPLEDVVGFVKNKGKNYTCCGYWKCYGDPVSAQDRFARFRKCTEVYLRCFRSGTPITRLAVAV